MERFVVGSGRCGSTLLSRMLGECPVVLSLFEFFTGLDMARRFAAEPLPGPELARLIAAEQPFVTAVLRRGYRVEEITYPFDEPHASGARRRYTIDDPLPWILVSLLPRLTDDPDALFDEVMRFVAGLPAQPPREHYRALFSWLAERDGRRCWIERSGSSIDYAAALIAEFPDARFVHIHRSGPEVALSMREHHAYRLPISLLYDVPLDDGLRVSELPPLDFASAPDPDDTISRILRSRPPASHFGRYWCDQILRGQPALAALGPERLLEIRFEDLVRRPRPLLEAIAKHFELAGDGGWIDAAASLIRGVPASRLQTLPAGERTALLAACEPGRRLLQARAPASL